MPSLTQPFPRKRRRDEDDPIDGDIHLAFPEDFHGYYPHHQQQQQGHHGAPPRKTISIPSPLAKKIRMSTAEWPNETEEPQRQTPLAPNPRHNNNNNNNNNSNASSTITNRPPSATTARYSGPKKATNLSPCHICHRKPTKKTELDSYADCKGCGERTCYVCIRECLGWKGTPTSATHDHHHHDGTLMRDDDHDDSRTDEDDDGEHWRRQAGPDQSFSMEDAPSGDGANQGATDHQDRTERSGAWGNGGGRGHRGRICSQCCVEDGPEGEVICLGCLGT